MYKASGHRNADCSVYHDLEALWSVASQFRRQHTGALQTGPQSGCRAGGEKTKTHTPHTGSLGLSAASYPQIRNTKLRRKPRCSHPQQESHSRNWQYLPHINEQRPCRVGCALKPPKGTYAVTEALHTVGRSIRSHQKMGRWPRRESQAHRLLPTPREAARAPSPACLQGPPEGQSHSTGRVSYSLGTKRRVLCTSHIHHQQLLC